MPELSHLRLVRVEDERPRKKKRGFGPPPDRDYAQHGAVLTDQVREVLQSFTTRQPPQGVNPNLILRVHLNQQAQIDEKTWEQSGLILLSVDKDKTLVLFSTDSELSDFRRRLGEYGSGPEEGRKNAPHTTLFANIDRIGEVRPQDRIGRLLRLAGVSRPEDIGVTDAYTIDVELWDLGSHALRQEKVEEIRRFVASHAGQVTDTYIGQSMVLLRVRGSGGLLRRILEIDAVATLDLPPSVGLGVRQMLALGVDDFAPTPNPDPSAPAVGVLDTGTTPGHPFLSRALGEATAVPSTLGDGNDGNGHGTMVSGLAIYGDVEECIRSRAFVPSLRLYSVQVLNDQGRFDDDRLITTQMRDAIRYLNETYGCRVFNLSLGDDRQHYQGGKVSPWASILDTLSRELDVLIIVSAGNFAYEPPAGASPESHLQNYPAYLLSEEARVIEPATGVIVLTVGAISNSAAVPPSAGGVAVRPIAQRDQPSPFTRSGPGLGSAIKPELCDYGGNSVYDGNLRGTRPLSECSVVSLNHQYLQGLFTTDNGTSFAAPRVAHIAAALTGLLPDMSANLLRALLAASAAVPAAAEQATEGIGNGAVLRICGYGRPDLIYARSSDENRVVLYSDATIGFDKFHIYEIPVPPSFISVRGKRRITVTLAFDPPVRHTRFDYLGATMSFRLIRGQTLSDVVEAFRPRTKDEESTEPLGSSQCPMEPKSGVREAGTLQKASFIVKRPSGTDYGETYYLVVRCERKWATDEQGLQRYAVTVTLEHQAMTDLYARISQRVQARVRTQG